MKRHLMAVATLMLAAGLGACVDLEETLVSNLSNEYIKTAAGLNDATNAIYTRLRGYYGREQMMALSDMGTDAMTNGDQVAGGAQAWFYLADYSSGLNSTDARIQATWNNFYIMIANANVVLANGPATPVGGTLTQAVKDSRLGEAHFLRALAYFELVRLFGDVTLNLDAATSISTAATRAPEADVYAAIIADLEEAIALLPVTQADWGRARRGAAQHLLAKVYLTRAYRPWNTANRQADFQRAFDGAKALINSGGYALVPVYADLWCGRPPEALAAKDALRQSYCNIISGSGFSEQNSEIIFSVQYSHTPTHYQAAWCGNVNVTDCASYVHLVYLTRYDNDNNIGAGLPRDLNNGRPFRRNRTTDFAHALFTQTRWAGTPGQSDILDTRFDGTFQTLWFATGANANGNSNAAGGYWAGQVCPNCTSGRPIAVNDTALWMPGHAVSDDFRRSKAFAIYVPCPTDPAQPCGDHFTSPLKDNKRKRIYGWEVSPSVKKHQDNGRRDAFDQAGGKDFIIMRLGETYLIAAEAAVELGNPGEAASLINVLRVRAASPNHKANPAILVSAGQMNLDFIMDERIRELHAEGMRWQDLVRPGAQFFLERLRRTNPDARANVREFHALRPIPQEQINGVTGTPYPQNPGY